MNRTLKFLVTSVISILLLGFPTQPLPRSTLSAMSSGSTVLVDPNTAARVLEAYGAIPLAFEANRGQTDARVKFLTRGSGYTLFLTADEAVLALAQSVLRMKLVGTNPSPRMAGIHPLPGRVNYFIGNDPSRWRTNLPTYAGVQYRDIYPGIDLVYYGNRRQLEHDFVVRPGGDPGSIVLAFQGTDTLEVDALGDLLLRTATGVLRLQKPFMYQEVGGARREISGGYLLKGAHDVGFSVASYDTGRPLVIDPLLIYSTYLGDSGADSGVDVAVDVVGDAYVTGVTSSANFPTTPGSFDTSTNGGNDVFVTKLSATGNALVYSTYLGGGGNDSGNDIAVDFSGNAYVLGQTNSDVPTPFPTTLGAFDTTFNGGFFDVFVSKLNDTGSGLVYSTYLGGSLREQGHGITVDRDGNAYIAGMTASSTNFPTTAGAFDETFNGGANCETGDGVLDAFVTKVNSGRLCARLLDVPGRRRR